MAVSDFKLSSRRGVSTTPTSRTGTLTSGKDSRLQDDSPKKNTMRRSRSVSAFSRSRTADVSADFSNSRDNPLFWSNDSPPSEEPHSIDLIRDGISTGISAGNVQSMKCGAVENVRGRSVSRNYDSKSNASGTRKNGDRSLSRSGADRRDRSVSRHTITAQSFVNSESEADRDSRCIAKSNNRKTPTPVFRDRRKVDIVRSSSDTPHQSRGVRTRSSQLSPLDLSDNCDAPVSCNFEDRLSTTSSLSESEGRTIQAVSGKLKSVDGDCLQGDTIISDLHGMIQYEVRRAIQDIHDDFIHAAQSSGNVIASQNVDIPPELVNPGAVELVMDLRSEYAKKLEQSKERARKLRADLAVEEHRGLELSRILREVIPAPKTSVRRKASFERRKMSKRLTDDALAYFDECVSLSTFDSSDFSSLEEAPSAVHEVSSTSQVGEGPLQESAIGTLSVIDDHSDHIEQTSYSSRKAVTVSPDNIPTKSEHFSLTDKPHETLGSQHNIEKYIQHCEKDSIGSQTVGVKYCYMNGVNLKEPAESLLFDRFIFRNRIESGGLLLCGVSSSSFLRLV